MEKIIINDHIQGDPLSEENLDKTLEYVNKIRLSFPNKTIWLYTGFRYNDCLIKPKMCEENIFRALRYEILKNVDVLVDGRYIDSQRNPSKKWAGSDNQRVISIPESLKQGKVVLYCE